MDAPLLPLVLRPPPQGVRALTLARLVEALARGRTHRDRDFVRELVAWLQARATHLSLELVERLALVDVVVTLHMRDAVKLVVTGHFENAPGEVTVTVRSEEFPFVMVGLHAEPRNAPYTMATLDYARSGRPVCLISDARSGSHRFPAGTRGTCVVESTMGADRYARLRLEGCDALLTIPSDRFRFV